MTRTPPSQQHRPRPDGRSNPRRLRVAPPPGGKRPGDWVGMRVRLRQALAGKPAGTKAQVVGGSHGGSGLLLRCDDDGMTIGSVTDHHIEAL